MVRIRSIVMNPGANVRAEYLIKQYLQTSKEEPVYQELWDQALGGVRKHLITYSKKAHFTILGERQEGLSNEITPKMDHLVCFMPGTIALGATEGRPLAEARKSSDWTQKQEEEMELAAELTKTCYGMYKAMLTGLAAEITHFEISSPPHMERHGRLSSSAVDFSAPSDAATDWKNDYIIKAQDAHNLQRPETVESLFYMWRITGDATYREWGWEIFASFVEHSRVRSGGGGFTTLTNANRLPPVQSDNMESFWLAETLKYLYLLFSPPDLLPLDTIVINTEAHIFPRFKLQRGLKTGWARKPRDANGVIVEPPRADEGPVLVAEGHVLEAQPRVRTMRVVDAVAGAGGESMLDREDTEEEEGEKGIGTTEAKRGSG